MPLGGQERDLRQRPSDHRVQAHRACVVEDLRLLETEPCRSLDDRRRRVGRATRHLRHLDAPVSDRDDVGEGAADVDAQHQRLAIWSPSGT